MKILYKRRLLRNHLVSGVFFIILGVIGFILQTSTLFSSYLVVIGLAFCIVYAVMKSKGYITIENGILTKNTGLFKQVKVKDIKKVIKFKESYRIDTNDTIITIHKSDIHDNSLLVLQDFFRQLQLDPTENILQKVS